MADYTSDVWPIVHGPCGAKVDYGYAADMRYGALPVSYDLSVTRAIHHCPVTGEDVLATPPSEHPEVRAWLYAICPGLEEEDAQRART
jgi:hypothetical protein